MLGDTAVPTSPMIGLLQRSRYMAKRQVNHICNPKAHAVGKMIREEQIMSWLRALTEQTTAHLRLTMILALP